MANNNLMVDLKGRSDIDGRRFYVGKLQFPGNIDCSEGVVFLIFVSENGAEQLQIAAMDKKNE